MFPTTKHSMQLNYLHTLKTDVAITMLPLSGANGNALDYGNFLNATLRSSTLNFTALAPSMSCLVVSHRFLYMSEHVSLHMPLHF